MFCFSSMNENNTQKEGKEVSTEKIDREIHRIDNAICRHIENIERDDRGEVAQDVVTDLRHFVEHVMLKIYANNQDIEDNYENLCKGIKYVESKGQYKNIARFHDFLQMVVSHYKPDEENSERLMLKYYNYLYEIRKFLFDKYNFGVLHNLEKFPLNVDPKMQEYYAKIAEEIEKFDIIENCTKGSRFYIQKVKPFFVKGGRYFEITFCEATDRNNKTDRLIAFTKIPIMSNYASRMLVVPTDIEIMNKRMPINIIIGWEVAIRDCEFKNFCGIITGIKSDAGHSETRSLCQFMTRYRINLVDIVCMSKKEYVILEQSIRDKAQVTVVLNALSECRRIINNNMAGENILRLLLYSMNNNMIKSQYYGVKSRYFSLYLKNGCIPFDKIPFNFSPIDHTVRYSVLLDCITYKDKIDQLLARHIKINAEVNGTLFTQIGELEGYGDVNALIERYNNRLYSGHRPQSEVRVQNNHAFIYSYVEDCKYILDKLVQLSANGLQNYSIAVSAWLANENTAFYCDEKKDVLKEIFANSMVGVLYGAAGTGKSTFIKLMSQYFADKDKLFLAQTNPAVDNLKRKVNVANCEYLTIAKFISNSRVKTEYDILIVDECSTVSNAHMRKVLEKASFKLLLLVGDTFQIASIRFGNWFSIVKQFIPKTSVYELLAPFRSEDERLLELWNRVRNMTDNVSELISRPEYSRRLDDSVFVKVEKDEIILCLNYDGLYGINNLNRFLQESNENKSYEWGLQQFKVGDPILFNESERFAPVIYNNMKGVIRGIETTFDSAMGEVIIFDVELDKILDGLDASGKDFEIIDEYECANTVVRFLVYKRRSEDDDDDITSNTIVPFQVAYAVSIHKAQGLEFDSVKVVITNEVDENISHNIFYTAITRARKHLKIYWSPEVQEKILTSIQPRNDNKDIALLKRTVLD